MDSPLTETFFIVIKIDVHRPLAVRAEVVPLGLGELKPVESKPSVTPLPGITERFSSMEPPLWVKGDRGCSEKQEISIARWGCPVREGGVVHFPLMLPQKDHDAVVVC